MLAMAAGREEDARGLLTLGMQLSEHAGQALRATEARLALATSLRLSHCDDARRLAQEAHEASVRLGLSRATERALQLLSELSGGPA